MSLDSDLSAVVTRVVPNLNSNLHKRNLHFYCKTIDSSSNCIFIDNPEKYHQSSQLKRQKISDYNYKLFEKENISSSTPNLHSQTEKISSKKTKNEENFGINELMLIATFAKAIFRFTINELLTESKSCPSFTKSVSFFRSFAEKYYDQITDLESLKWIWTINEEEGVWLVTCKKVYKEFSMRFFRDERVITKWIDDKFISQIIHVIYSKYKDILEKSFINPDILAQLVPILITLGL